MAIDPRIPLAAVQPIQQANPLELYQQVLQVQGLRAQAEERRAAAEIRKRAAETEQAIKGAVTIAPDGQPTVDWPKLLPHLAPDKVFEIANLAQENATRMAEAKAAGLKTETLQRQYLAGLGEVVQKSGNDQRTFEAALTSAKLAGVISPTDLEQGFAFSRDPAFRQTRVNNAIALKPAPEAGDLVEIQTVDEQGRPVTRFVPKTADTSYPAAPKPTTQRALQAKDVLLDGKPALATFDPDSGTYHVGGQDVTARVRPIPPQGPGPEPIVAIIGADGKPVYVTRSQALGQTPTGAAAGTDKLSAAQQEDIATMLTVQDLGKEAAQLGDQIKWRGVGPVAGRTGAIGAKYFGAGGEQPERLRNLLGNIQGTIAKLRGGTSFTPGEQALLDRYTPTVTDSPLQIKTKLKSLSDFITTKRENTLRVASGQYTPRETKTGEAQTDPMGIR